jgi:hypothetical protein
LIVVDYSAVKAGVLSFTESLATELGSDGIRVNSVIAGPVAGAGGRIAGSARSSPSEIAALVVALASPRLHSISGAELVIDGVARPTAADVDALRVAGDAWSMSEDLARLVGAGQSFDLARAVDEQRERHSLVEALLTGGGPPSVTLWEAVDRIGLPRDRPFVVAAVASTEWTREPTPGIEGRLRRGGMESAWLQRADVELGIVSCRPDQLPALRDTIVGYGVRAGISPLQSDHGRIPQTVRLARAALAAAASDEVAFFADSAIGAMAAGAPDIAGALTAIVLAPVLELPADEQEVLLATVRQWFECNGSVARTARAMFVHPNTVYNRIRRVEALTDRTLANPRHAAEIYLALVSLAMTSRTPAAAPLPIAGGAA